MSAFIQRVVSELAQISNPVLRELQIKSLAEKTKVSEENIFQTLNNSFNKFNDGNHIQNNGKHRRTMKKLRKIYFNSR